MAYISFVRHGKSLVDGGQKIKGGELRSWIEDYNRSGVHPPPENIIGQNELPQLTPYILTSDLKRAVESAAYLFNEAGFERNSIFREADLPDPPRIFSSVRMSASLWSAAVRMLWLCGYSRNIDSVAATKMRAKEAACSLIDCASRKRHVVLVGHGFFNRMVAGDLLKEGWKPKCRHGSKNWDITTYQKAE